MSVQDDRRENELVQLFLLQKPANPTRSGIDAILDLNGQKIPFELKSTTKSSVTTVRDLSPKHIKKWQDKHWLFGFYDRGGTTLKYCLYGSPQKMANWIGDKQEYIKTDIALAQIVPELITTNVLSTKFLAKKIPIHLMMLGVCTRDNTLLRNIITRWI